MCKVLIFSCISAVMLMTAADGAALSAEEMQRGLLKTLIDDLRRLDNIKDNIHVDLYTPNEKEECAGQSLRCYLTEMSTLENEIEHENVQSVQSVQNIKKNLQNLTDLIPARAGCKICEANKKNKFPAFRQELIKLLQSIQK